MFELREVRDLIRRAPLAWCLAVAVTFVLALPLYLLKVALVPRDAMWVETIVFICSIYPAKVITGWAYARACRRTEFAWWGWRWLARAAALPVLGGYVFLLYFTQFIGAHGRAVLFEQHAFLLPAPF